MNVFYEEDGGFKVGAVLVDNTASLQVETLHGKRSKVKIANVMLRFAQPGLTEFMAQAERVAADMDVAFLWECSPPDEFDFDALATEYFGRKPLPAEAAGALIRLHSAPMYFYKKGKGRYKAAPPDALKAALAGAEKKRLHAEMQARFTEQLRSFILPPEFVGRLPQLLYRPDRSTIEVKALEAACAATQMSAAHLLQKCGAIPSTHDFHLQRFLFEHFPQGVGFPEVKVDAPSGLPVASVRAFSIDDASTTEIDDAFSVVRLDNGHLRIGVHIAAPALTITPGSAADEIAIRRMSTVYMPGDKITMLPDNVVQVFTLDEGKTCPALSMYLLVDGSTLDVISNESCIENIYVVANLRIEELELLFNEKSLEQGKLDYPFADELATLWDFAQKREAARGKSADGNVQQTDYNFQVVNDHVTITQRRRGSPIDKVVSELMIYVNSEWGRQLAEKGVAGIYRTQSNGKVKMSMVPAPHQGLGVSQYLWSSSPLRRYVDLMNQRQIISMLRQETPSYAKNDIALHGGMRDFDAAYTVYAEFQRNMERYWCLRWLMQEQVQQAGAVVLRENLVRFERIPLIGRIPSLPELAPGSCVMLEFTDFDLLELSFTARFISHQESVA